MAAYLAAPSSAQQPVAIDPGTSPAPDSGTTPAATGVTTALLNVVSELTGYPVEMLSLDMDVEADLGIDSIKRVEILSALEDCLANFPAIAPDEMAELKTLGQIADRLKPAADEPGPVIPDHSDPSDQPAGAASQETVHDALMAVVSELTGYPVEMLTVEMDIEADLGIDSIKRVEILSAMEDRLPSMPVIAPDDMAELKTLGQIEATLAGNQPAATEEGPTVVEPSASIPPAEPSVAASDTPPGQLVRRELTVIETSRPDAPALTVPSDRKIFITTDKAGLSHALADQLAARGLHTVQISIDILKHREDLPDAAGLILLCDNDHTDADASAHLKAFLAHAFDLTRHLGPSLLKSAQESGAVLATISRLDGTFGVDGLNRHHPYQGGLAGLAKTAAIEWPEVTCRALDIDANWQDNPAIAREIVAELFLPPSSSPVEVGWRQRERVTLALQSSPVADQPQQPLALEDGDVVVISGGARGVTAAAAEALARQRALTLILLGRSPLPFEEPEWLDGRESESDLKKAIIAHAFSQTHPTPQACLLYTSDAADERERV